MTITSVNELADPGITPVRIFCATYTMASNHDGNVKTMRSTWTKRCDGYVAFSTKSDPDIPAVLITHEGVSLTICIFLAIMLTLFLLCAGGKL